MEFLFALGWITCVLDTFIKFCQYNNGQTKPSRLQVLQALDNICTPIEMVNHPICINEVTHA